ncbi:VanZ family protein [Intestinibacter sp.]
MKKKAKIIILTIIVILWMAFIFSMSAKNSTQSSSISGGFIHNILNLFFAQFREIDKTTQESIVEGLQFIVRKGAHFSAYTILGGLCFVDLTVLDKYKLKNNFIIAFAVAALYATSDEIHQYFVPGRSCELRDVMIDSCGVLFGITVVIVFNKVIDKIKG